MKPTLAMIIKARRLVRGMDQAALAAALQCDARTVARWESGDLPSVRHLKRLRSILEISITDMDALVLATVAGEDHQVRVEGPGVLDRLDLTYEDLLKIIMDIEQRATGIEDPIVTGTNKFWASIFEALPDSWRVLTRGNRIVGIWHMIPLSASAYQDFRRGELSEGQIGLRNVEAFDFPTICDVVICSFVIDRPARTQTSFSILLSSLLEAVDVLARRNVTIRSVCMQAWTPHVSIMCRRLGFRDVGTFAHESGGVSILEAEVREILAHPALDRVQNRNGVPSMT